MSKFHMLLLSYTFGSLAISAKPQEFWILFDATFTIVHLNSKP